MTETQIMDRVHHNYRIQYEKDHKDLDNMSDEEYINNMMKEIDTLSKK
jgi:hypothetical protein